MLTIPDILNPRHVILDLQANTGDEAIEKVASLLRQDERIRDWVGFYTALKHLSHRVDATDDFEICIPHTRTDCVNTMVMSVGRSSKGVSFADSKKPVRYFFCIGLPKEMASEYLRIIGAIARFFKDPEMIRRLDHASTTAEFVSILSEKEMAL